MNDFITEQEKIASLHEVSTKESASNQKQFNSKQFKTGTNEAFIELGALKPDYNWSMFDVDEEKAQPKLLVTTIWNIGRSQDSSGSWIPTKRTIYRDEHDGTYWYGVRNPDHETGKLNRNHRPHWDRLQLALN